MSRLAALALGLALAAAAGAPAGAQSMQATPAAAPASPAATPKGPLRHLSFTVAIDLRTETDMRTIDVAANRGGNTENYTASGASHGTIVCDIVGVTADGNLLVDVIEDAGDRSAPLRRVALQRDGTLVFLPKQPPLTEEESELVALLAPNLLGGERAVGDAWTYRQNAPGYSATKTFRLTDIKAADDVLLGVEETYERTGAEHLSGTITGTVSYDPGGLVPHGAKLTKTTRQEDTTGYKTRKLGMDFELTEDSRAKR